LSYRGTTYKEHYNRLLVKINTFSKKNLPAAFKPPEGSGFTAAV